MKITHHPESESLMSCSAGSMPEAFAAVMASHMAMCPSCQKELAFMETIGVAMFENIAPSIVSSDAPVMALRASEANRGDHAICTVNGDVPYPLLPVIGTDLGHIEWKRLSPGVWQHIIPLSEKVGGDLRLIKVAPGQALPEHGHSGSELTLVLQGSYRDHSGQYGVGDVADLAGDTTHTPIADQKDGCICLIATEGKLRFTGLVARMVQPFAGI
jgi:putative transcriptional regulator